MSGKIIKCEINNKKIEVSEGTSIIEAFKKLDQPIAHYCWHPGLSVAGVCRLCMVEVEGIPKLQIACNTQITEGMKISNQSEKVKAAVRWGLEFHLINHPLDCPICDQAGECELQEQYMYFGKYSPNMSERKVKKRKVVDLGSKIVLDSERCILCSRCVRFTDEVSKTHELGIFNRGDKSEIGVFKDKPLDNEYAVNTVDICPVGALTSKEFRFQQRVWYLKTADSICTGCSTGCNIKVDYNEEGLFRVRPRYNKEINGYWMCDKGREIYRLPNRNGRLWDAKIPSSDSDSLSRSISSVEALKKLRKLFLEKTQDGENSYRNDVEKLNSQEANKAVLILTAQYTTEEYEDVISFFLKFLGTKESIFYWKNNPENFNNFDGLLLRGDKNPNTKGLMEILQKKEALNSWEDLQKKLETKRVETIWVAGPENQKVYPDIEEKVRYFESHCKNIVWWTAHPLPDSQKMWQIPAKTFFEKDGTIINFAGKAQKLKVISSFVPSALSLSESVAVLRGEELKRSDSPFLKVPMKANHFTYRKKVL
ncbi:MAG: 2Fe-2S iron-sulfur cluster binding domain-containing protein [Oligoflexia bacterium]|nr:2Fe-2S iron-sulfur cluster binding domain-containing protein [Oligoflexia bacterium]